MRQNRHFIILFLLTFLTNIGTAQMIKRAPYLQSPTTNSVVIKWKTAVDTNAVVRYGLQANSLVDSAEDPEDMGRGHTVQLTNLSPNTKYYYSIGTTDTTFLGGTEDYFFHTKPLVPAEEIRIWVLGDSGTGYSEQYAVRDAFYDSGNAAMDFMVLLGDNAYSDGEDWEYQDNFFDVYESRLLHTPVWSCPGNHDYVSCDEEEEEGPYFKIFHFPKNGELGGAPSQTERYYSFDQGSAHFVMIDGLLTTGAIIDWLNADLAQNELPWVIATLHYPPYTKGSRDSDDEDRLINVRERIMPVLEAAGVDLVLTGHSHAYERSYLLNGHYGYSNEYDPAMALNEGNGQLDGDGAYLKTESNGIRSTGTVYAVVGTSGGKGPDEGLDHPAMFYSSESAGYGLLDITSTQLDFTFVNEDGQTEDYFTMQKVEATEVDNDDDGFSFDEDCDDVNANANPGGTEIPNNEIDEDCDGLVLMIDEDNDGYNSDEDCNDNDALINPAATEILDNDIDENCDGLVEVTNVGIDNDNDGFVVGEDCDDENGNINPAATEIPNNSVDENCDGLALVIDVDNDGFNSDEDCNDENPNINPVATEIPNNLFDENCDGIILIIDADNDGFNSDEDCNDNNAMINPAATEIPDNNIDENCDGVILIIGNTNDQDNDGFLDTEDCDDLNANINPGATEIPNNSIDENCDGIILVIDEDDDGFNSDEDCDDENANIYPGAWEIANNTVDENCDGIIIIIDFDNDGYNSDDDCDDFNLNINPGATEIINNNVDENCDGVILIDNDNDGFFLADDCDDLNPMINPNATEIPNNNIDENCDGIVFIIDNDNDGSNSDDDCDDENPNINPAATEIPNNDVDEDCDGIALIIDNDNDGYNSDDDCDDENPNISPAGIEIPNNGIDEDCDGTDLIDTHNKNIAIRQFMLYPNPATTNLFVQVKEQGLFEGQIFNVMGEELISFSGSETITAIDIASLPSGLFLLRITDDSIGANAFFKFEKM